MEIKLEDLLDITRKAGDAILEVYNDEEQFKEVDFKSDDSPLTLADKRANEVIEGALKNKYPDIPILSEEGRSIPYSDRKDWDMFWLVDPLDGTKEFIKRNGEFTVNIALIKQQYPVMGVVYAPARHTHYSGNVLLNEAFKHDDNGSAQAISVNDKSNNRIAVQSRSHASEEEQELLSTYDVNDSISIGSSLKFCMVAEGKADIYYRHGPTMEWDTGAGQAVLEAAGGHVLRMDDKRRFYYNKEDLLNRSFLCLGFDK